MPKISDEKLAELERIAGKEGGNAITFWGNSGRDLIADLREAREQLIKAEAALELTYEELEPRAGHRHESCTPKSCGIIAARTYFTEKDATPKGDRS